MTIAEFRSHFKPGVIFYEGHCLAVIPGIHVTTDVCWLDGMWYAMSRHGSDVIVEGKGKTLKEALASL
jgi:hypothetical protein